MDQQPGGYPPRPMNLSEVLDAVVHLYLDNFSLFLALAAVVYVPYGILNALVRAGSSTTSLNLIGSDQGLTTSHVQVLTVHSLDFTALRLVASILLLLYAVILLPVGLGALTKAGADRHLRQKASFGDAFRAAWERRLPLIGLILLIAAITVGAVLVLAVVGVILYFTLKVLGVLLIVLIGLVAVVFAVMAYVRIVAAVPAVVLEPLGPWQAIQRSWNLSRGHSWFIFGVLLVIAVASAILSGILVAVVGALAGTAGGGTKTSQLIVAAVTLVLSVLLAPIGALAGVLLYFNLRGRLEGPLVAPDGATPVPA